MLWHLKINSKLQRSLKEISNITSSQCKPLMFELSYDCCTHLLSDRESYQSARLNLHCSETCEKKTSREISLLPVHHDDLLFLRHITTQITVALNIEHTPNALPRYICSHIHSFLFIRIYFIRISRLKCAKF